MFRKPVIIFDWDGTIADSMDLCVEEVRRSLQLLGLPPVSEELMRACNGPTFEETVPLLGIPADLAARYMALRQEYGLSLCATVNRLFSGVKDMLLSLQNKADLCIASNGTAAYIANCLKVFDMDGIFSRVLAAKSGRTKAQAVAEILSELQPEKAIMVGDRLGDISAGKANDLPTICCAYGYGNATEWAAADRSAASISDLQEMLEDFVE